MALLPTIAYWYEFLLRVEQIQSQVANSQARQQAFRPVDPRRRLAIQHHRSVPGEAVLCTTGNYRSDVRRWESAAASAAERALRRRAA
jgi:hypothetical protein